VAVGITWSQGELSTADGKRWKQLSEEDLRALHRASATSVRPLNCVPVPLPHKIGTWKIITGSATISSSNTRPEFGCF
jgi:hypothetical protein